MKRTVKFLLLFLALLLPGLVYVFLKSFGRNEFEVAQLYQDSVAVQTGCESFDYAIPYVVPDLALAGLGGKPASLNLFVADKSSHDVAVQRMLTEFPDGGFSITEITPSALSTATCVLLLQPPLDAAVVGVDGSIRGQYDLDDRDEVDRLILEMNIILKKY
jgi:hypothetical protein